MMRDHKFKDEWSFQRTMSRGNPVAGKPIAADQPCFTCGVPFKDHRAAAQATVRLAAWEREPGAAATSVRVRARAALRAAAQADTAPGGGLREAAVKAIAYLSDVSLSGHSQGLGIRNAGEVLRAALAAPSRDAGLDVERLARAFDLNGVNWPKRWGDNDFAWLARQVAAEYARLASPADESEAE